MSCLSAPNPRCPRISPQRGHLSGVTVSLLIYKKRENRTSIHIRDRNRDAPLKYNKSRIFGDETVTLSRRYRPGMCRDSQGTVSW